MFEVTQVGAKLVNIFWDQPPRLTDYAPVYGA